MSLEASLVRSSSVVSWAQAAASAARDRSREVVARHWCRAPEGLLRGSQREALAASVAPVAPVAVAPSVVLHQLEAPWPRALEGSRPEVRHRAAEPRVVEVPGSTEHMCRIRRGRVACPKASLIQ